MSSDAPSAERSKGGPSRRGMMFILSSPSGAGKTTLASRLIAHEGACCVLSISATTRKARPGETNGVHYHFIDRGEFEARREQGEFLEWAEVFGNLYGTPRDAVETSLRDGLDVVFDIDWQGARQLAESAPADVVRIFILPPSREVLRQRLSGRAADPAEVVKQRLAGASDEMSHWDEYDYVVVNADLDESFTALRTILAAERLKRSRAIGLAELVDELIRGE